MRKYTLITLIVLMINLIVPTSVQAVSFTPSVEVASEAVYMVNLDSDTVVYKKNENKLMSPASLAKIMTAALVLEKFKDNPEALKTTYISAPSAVFDELYKAGASTADFRINEMVSYNNLLYGLMLQSACEAANIIAYNMGDGDIAKFIKMMNDKAAELGATNTNFTNAHGLYDDAQRTSARDLALITEYAMTFPTFMEIANTVSYDLEPTSVHSQPRTVNHTNYMMSASAGGSEYYYQYVKGIKTGTLEEAGRCLVTTASKDGYNYLLVTLGGDSVPMKDESGKNNFYNFTDHKSLYEWAFENLSDKKILSKDTEVGRVEVKYGDKANHVLVKPLEDYSCLWSKEIPDEAVKQVLTMEESVVAPVHKGEVLGTLELIYNGETIKKVDLIATSSVQRDELQYKLSVAKQFTSSKMFKTAAFACVSILIIYTILFIIVRSKRKNKRTFNRRKTKKRK